MSADGDRLEVARAIAALEFRRLTPSLWETEVPRELDPRGYAMDCWKALSVAFQRSLKPLDTVVLYWGLGPEERLLAHRTATGEMQDGSAMLYLELDLQVPSSRRRGGLLSP